MITKELLKIMEIHNHSCKYCPSALGEKYGHDDESIQVKEWVATGVVKVEEYVFPCAWRVKKLCKGICDYLGFKG